MFLIEQFTQDHDYTLFEKLAKACSGHIQHTTSRQSIKSCRFVPELNRVFIRVGCEVQAFGMSKKDQHWFQPSVTINFKPYSSQFQKKATVHNNNLNKYRKGTIVTTIKEENKTHLSKKVMLS
jgi:hypothetical protein